MPLCVAAEHWVKKNVLKMLQKDHQEECDTLPDDSITAIYDGLKMIFTTDMNLVLFLGQKCGHRRLVFFGHHADILCVGLILQRRIQVEFETPAHHRFVQGQSNG